MKKKFIFFIILIILFIYGYIYFILLNDKKKSQNFVKIVDKKNNFKVKKNQISAILLSYKRIENVKKIIQNLLKYKFIKEIIIWNNNEEIKLTVSSLYLLLEKNY
jgi:Tfp pilus assembly protein PilO